MPNTTNNIPQRVIDVYQVFENFFGEQFVDLQRSGGRYVIMVWWPSVVVTNDFNKSVLIKDLYARVEINLDGTIPYELRGFQLNRTTFSSEQWASGYSHSHIPSLYHREVPHFANPCLGTGPINNTIMDLKNAYEEAVWMLFCQELSLYVTVESLRGGPYIKMETIGALNKLSGFQHFTTVDCIASSFKYNLSSEYINSLIKDFTLWYLKNGHLKFDYSEESFKCGLSYYEFMIDISNAFIEYFNIHGNSVALNTLYHNDFILQVKVSQGMFYRNSAPSPHSTDRVEGSPMFSFKGEIKRLHIEPPTNTGEATVTTLLHHEIAMYILGKILRIINYRYSNEHNKLPESGSTQEGASSTYQAVLYL